MEDQACKPPATMDPEKGGESRTSSGIDLDEPRPGTAEQTPEQDVLTGFKLYITLFSLTITGFLISLDASVVVTAIPKITAHFNSIADIGWYGSAYAIANCVLQFNAGKIYRHHSIKITFLVFLSIFEVGSLICGISRTSFMLIIGRAISGIGASGLMNGGFVVLATVSPIDKRPLYLGIVMAFILLGIVAGPLLGGLITEDASWRWCFYINLPMGGFSAAVCVLTRWPTTSPTERLSFWESFKRLDPVGFLTFAPSCIMLLLALQWGGTKYAWGSATVIGLFCGFAASLCVFLGWEFHCGDKAMIPLNMLRQRIVYSSAIASTLQMGGLMIFTYFLPVWFQVIKAASPSKSGVYFLGTIGPQIMFAILSGAMITRFGYYIPFSIGGNAVSAIGLGLMSTLTTSSDTGRYIGYQILCGVGRGAVMQQPITAVQTAIPAAEVSVGSALVVFTQFFGGAIFVSLGQTIFINSLGSALQKYAPAVAAQFVINVGATNLRDVIPVSELNGVLMAYNEALINTFYLSAGAAVGAFVASFGMGWVNVKTAKKVQTKA